MTRFLRLSWLAIGGLCVGLIAGCAGTEASQASNDTAAGKGVTTKSGLMYTDEKEGTGPAAKAGDRVVVHYTGWLKDGTKFDSSHDHGKPFEFPLGAGKVIKGWDQGIAGMKVGGKRKLIIPPQLGYGMQGAGDAVPPNATLIFEIELVSINNPK